MFSQRLFHKVLRFSMNEKHQHSEDQKRMLSSQNESFLVQLSLHQIYIRGHPQPTQTPKGEGGLKKSVKKPRQLFEKCLRGGEGVKKSQFENHVVCGWPLIGNFHASKSCRTKFLHQEESCVLFIYLWRVDCGSGFLLRYSGCHTRPFLG